MVEALLQAYLDRYDVDVIHYREPKSLVFRYKNGWRLEVTIIKPFLIRKPGYHYEMDLKDDHGIRHNILNHTHGLNAKQVKHAILRLAKYALITKKGVAKWA